MEKRYFLKVLLWSLATPIMLVSVLLEVFCSKSIRRDIEECMFQIENYGKTISIQFIEALIIAEDHRNPIHPGIDVIAILRAIFVRLVYGKTQGASTIEQQFVRVVSSRYERTLSRKLREQLIALMLVRRADKHAIASAYLSIAYYGAGNFGVNGLKSMLGDDLSTTTFREALTVVTYLKYPKPFEPIESWSEKIRIRLRLLIRRSKIDLDNIHKTNLNLLGKSSNHV